MTGTRRPPTEYDMSKLPTPQHTTAQRIYELHERNAENGHRPHLGASVIGHECKRHLWNVFRWVKAPQFDGRMLRLFDTGKREEARVLDELRAIGCEVWDADENGQQFTVSAVRGHFGGSVDGVVQGLPEAPKTPHLFECKTHKDKSFKTLAKSGIPERHRWQMQAYMTLLGLSDAVYVAVNKDTDEIHVERVKSDPDLGARVLSTAEYVIDSPEPPVMLSDDPEHFACKLCQFHPVCHGKTLPEVNCRTCAHSTPVDDGKWRCEHHGREISTHEQRKGCQAHVYIPATVSKHLTLEDAGSNGSVTWLAVETGKTISQPPYTSHDLRNADGVAVLGDEFPAQMVERGAKVAPWSDLKDDLPWDSAA